MSTFFKREPVVLNGRLVQRRFEFYGFDTEVVNRVVHKATIQSATTSTVTLATSASDADDTYNGMGFVVNSGTGSGQDHQRISDYNGTTKVATLNADFTTTPDSTSVVSIIDRGY